jgi:hypothetical protein
MENALDQILDTLRDLARDAQGVYDIVYNGALPEQDSMVMALTAGGEVNVGLDYYGDHNLDIVCNAKHADQQTVIRALTAVHLTLRRMKTFPSGDGWRINSVSTSSMPRFLERDSDQFLYGSGFSVLVTID